MQAARGDAREVGADVAAARHARADAHEDTAEDAREGGAGRDRAVQGPDAARGGGDTRADHDAEVREAVLVGEDRAVQLRRVARLLPVRPAGGVAAEQVGDAAAPQREGARDPPGAAGDEEHARAEHGEDEGAGPQRPGAAQHARGGRARGRRHAHRRRVAAGLDAARDGVHDGERDERHGEGAAPAAEVVGEEEGIGGGEVAPQLPLPGGERRARDETGQREDDRALSRTDREERPGGAGAAELHPDGEEERADEQAESDRSRARRGRGAEESGPGADDEREERGGRTEEEGVGAQPGAVADRDELPPGGGEAEAGVEERDAEGDAEQEQHAGLGAVLGPGPGGEPGADDGGDGERDLVDGRQGLGSGRRGARGYGGERSPAACRGVRRGSGGGGHGGAFRAVGAVRRGGPGGRADRWVDTTVRMAGRAKVRGYVTGCAYGREQVSATTQSVVNAPGGGGEERQTESACRSVHADTIIRRLADVAPASRDAGRKPLRSETGHGSER
ncbi:putative integral membrane protein [Streptomyces sp. Tu6071]|nr:putative integral membrane protein [Streptomyces sp. Tu6071]